MSKDETRSRDNYKAMVKVIKKINDNEKLGNAARKKARAQCMHKRGNNFTLVRQEAKVPGEPVTWACKTCGAKIMLQRISEKDLQSAVDTVYQACNMVKVSLRDESEKDRHYKEMICDLMFKLDSYIVPLYKAAVSSNGNRKRDRDDRRRSSIDWESSGRY